MTFSQIMHSKTNKKAPYFIFYNKSLSTPWAKALMQKNDKKHPFLMKILTALTPIMHPLEAWADLS